MAWTSIARRAALVIEPLVGQIFFAPEPTEEYGQLGVDAASGYFLSRSAAMGRATPQTVAAAFFNFNPRIVGKLLKWETTDPDAITAARLRGIERAGARLLAADDGSLPDLGRAIALLREATEACRPEGRALFAAHSRLPWPETPIAAMWHGGNLLREYRGDGHIAVLLTHGIDAVESLVLHAAFRRADPSFLFATRAWGEDAYADARTRLAERGFVALDGTITDAGGKFREMIENETDHLAVAPFARLGDAGSEELLALLAPLSERVVARGAIPDVVKGFWQTASA